MKFPKILCVTLFVFGCGPVVQVDECLNSGSAACVSTSPSTTPPEVVEPADAAGMAPVISSVKWEGITGATARLHSGFSYVDMDGNYYFASNSEYSYDGTTTTGTVFKPAIRKFDKNGNLVWVKMIDLTSTSVANPNYTSATMKSMNVDSSNGDLYVLMDVRNTTSDIDSINEPLAIAGSFLIKFASDGTKSWSRRIRVTAASRSFLGSQISFTRTGRLLVTGWADHSIDGGPVLPISSIRTAVILELDKTTGNINTTNSRFYGRVNQSHAVGDSVVFTQISDTSGVLVINTRYKLDGSSNNSTFCRLSKINMNDLTETGTMLEIGTPLSASSTTTGCLDLNKISTSQDFLVSGYSDEATLQGQARIGTQDAFVMRVKASNFSVTWMNKRGGAGKTKTASSVVNDGTFALASYYSLFETTGVGTTKISLADGTTQNTVTIPLSPADGLLALGWSNLIGKKMYLRDGKVYQWIGNPLKTGAGSTPVLGGTTAQNYGGIFYYQTDISGNLL